MSGRSIFETLDPVIRSTLGITRLMPTFLFRWTWPLVRSLPGLGGTGLRYVWAANLFAEIGSNVRLGPGCTFEFWERITCGDNVSFHRSCYIDARGTITIGSDVSIAHNSSLVAFDHTFDDRSTPIKYNPLRPEPIQIASDVWIGCGVRVLAGARLGPRTVIAAGAVVPSGAYDAGVFAGVPAKKLKTI